MEYRSAIIIAALLHAVLMPAPLATLHAADVKPETSPIVAVVPDLMHMQKWDDMHGDTADPFWADDDNLYHFTCDGRGFGKEKRNICFNKLTGPDVLHLKGELVNSMDEYGKANALAGPNCVFRDKSAGGTGIKPATQSGINRPLKPGLNRPLLRVAGMGGRFIPEWSSDAG